MNREKRVVLNRMVEMMGKLQTFEAATLKQLLVLNKSLSKDLKKELKKQTGKTYLSKKRMLAILNETEIAINSINAIVAEQAARSFVEAGLYSFTTMKSIASWDNAIDGFNNVSLSKEKLLSLVTEQKLGGMLLTEWIDKTVFPDIEKVKTDIQKGIIKGQGYKSLLNDIISKVEIYKNSKEGKNLETAVISYVQSVNAVAQESVINANKDVIKNLEWSAIMENGNTKTGKGTCPRCMGLDGLKWPVGSSDMPPCPLHARCRCMRVPETLTWKELGLDVDEMNTKYRKWYERDENRNKLDFGETDLSFGDWWKTKNKTFQDNAIGPTRANLVRDGFIEFNDIVDKETGELVLIEDLFKTIGGNPYPTKKIAPKKKKSPVKMDTVYQTAKGFLNGVPSVMLDSYHKKIIKADDKYAILNSTTGAYHLNGDIHMNKANSGSKKEGMTFLHEYGHRLDYVNGPLYQEKYGGIADRLFVNYFSATNDYNNAMLADSRALTKIDSESYKILGGEGRYTRNGLFSLKNEKFIEVRKKVNKGFEEGTLDTKELKKRVAHYKKIKIKKQFEPYEKVTDLIFNELLESANKKGGSSKTNFLIEAYNFYITSKTSLIVASETGAKTYIINDWLTQFRYVSSGLDKSRAGLYIADAIGGTTSNKYGYGHSNSYYRQSKHRRNAESFANIFALSGNKNTGKVLKDLLPRQVELFEKLLGELL